jgi:hypothetical protein
MSLIVLAKVGFVTCAVMALYFWTMYRVGSARGKHGILPPRCDGPDEFVRVFRVQQNTLEQVVLFLPLLWLAGIFFNPLFAAVLGWIWVIARVWYALAYSKAAEDRLPPFIIGIIVDVVLFIMALYGVIMAMLTP